MVGSFAFCVLVFVAITMHLSGGYLEALPYVMRPTAWLAFALFIMAFTASSVRILRPSGYGKWAMKNRRYVGLSFAAVHFIHAILVLSNILLTEETRTAGQLSGGGLAYLFLLMMAATSNNASVRKLGAKNWKRLHKIGSYYIWLIFVARAVPVALTGELSGAIIAIVGFMALIVRIMAYRNLRRK